MEAARFDVELSSGEVRPATGQVRPATADANLACREFVPANHKVSSDWLAALPDHPETGRVSAS
jgi:hypothetical protein